MSKHQMNVFLESIQEKSNRHITLSKVILEAAKQKEVSKYFANYSCDSEKLIDLLNEALVTKESVAVISSGITKAEITKSVKEVVRRSESLSAPEPPDFKTFLYAMILYTNSNGTDTHLLYALKNSGFNFNKFLDDYEGRGKPQKMAPKQQQQTESESSVIESLCTNLNKQAAAGKIDPVIGRDEEILKTMEILSKRKKNNVVLVGKPGVGKTAIAEGLALSIVNGTCPPSLKGSTVYSLEVANMMAGTEFRGSFEKRMVELLSEFKIKEEKGEFPILFIDELHGIVSGGGASNFGNIVKPALSRGDLRCIGATTEDEWSKFFHEEKALKRRFTVVHVDEPTRDQTIDILKGAKTHYENKHQVTYSDESLVKCVDLSIEFIPELSLPDKALDLFDLAGAIYKLKNVQTIGLDEVEYALSRMKKVSLDVIKEKRKEVVIEPMAPKIKRVLFGQDASVEKIVKSVEKYKVGLKRPDKPIGSFLFVGPTGVGKTELAKLMAKEMKVELERIDMSEFMEQHSVSKFIGSPKGYVGSDEQSKLSKIFDKHSRFVLLLDEIEKAHPKVLEILLQIMDYAKVTDSREESLNFKDVLIIMTSNVGASELSETSIGLIDESKVAKKINKKSIENAFTAEFRNRLTDILIFNSLTPDMVLSVVDKSLKALVIDPLLAQGINVKVAESVKKWIVDKSYDVNYGARPIERFIDAQINEKITESILYGDVLKGKKDIEISLENDQLKFSYA